MIFNRERGIVGATPKADLLAEEPNAYLRTEYDENNARVFFVCTGSLTAIMMEKLGQTTSGAFRTDEIKELDRKREQLTRFLETTE